jgi:hypothetical protein
MEGIKSGCEDRERALEKSFGFGESADRSAEHSEIVGGHRNIGMVRSQQFLLHGERPAIKRFSF